MTRWFRSLLPAPVLACVLVSAGCTSEKTNPPDTDERPLVSDEIGPIPGIQALSVLNAVQLNNGLVVEQLRFGSGEAATPGAVIDVHYQARLPDGSVFDETDGAPRTLPLDRLIAGWRDGLVGMRTGGIWRLHIPAALGYGSSGNARLGVPPHAPLTYDIHLVAVRHH